MIIRMETMARRGKGLPPDSAAIPIPKAVAIAGDIAEFEDVKRIADEAIHRFGGFDHVG
jgi:hypothetical protein